MSTVKKKHHYIPQFLLKRFAIEDVNAKGKKAARIFQIDKPGAARSMAITEVAASKNFHGPAENGLEDAIGAMETEFLEVLTLLDSGTPPHKHSGTISRLVWLQIVRTRASRQIFANIIEAATSSIAQGFSSGRGKNEISRIINSELEEMISDALIKQHNAQTRQQRKFITKNVKKKLSNPSVRIAIETILQSQITNSMPEVMNQLTQLFHTTGIVQKTAENAHIRGLQSLTKSRNTPEKLATICWEMVHFPDRNLVLGDCCAFLIFPDGSTRSTFTLDHNWSVLVFPISSSQALIGTQIGSSTELTAANINAASARCSTDYIYSPTKNDSTLAIAPLIGSEAWLSNDPEFLETLNDVWLPKDAS